MPLDLEENLTEEADNLVLDDKIIDGNMNQVLDIHEAPQEENSSAGNAGNMITKSPVYNTMDIPNIALASMRHHTGLRETAEIATAAWVDAGLITAADSHLVIDHNKIKRAQEKLVAELQNEFENNITKNGISCILFDGRKDDTRVMLKINGCERSFPGLIKEEHYSVCSEPCGSYLYHFVPEDSDKKRHAEIIADHLVDWLVKHGFESQL